MKKPNDHKSKQLGSGARAVKAAIAESAANLVQRGLMDNLMVKLVEILRIVEAEKEHAPGHAGEHRDEFRGETLAKIEEILHLTRPQIDELRKSVAPPYPSKEVEEIVNEAIDKMTEVLIGGR